MAISSLGYVGFNVSNLDGWQKFATNFLGMMPVDKNGDTRKFRIDHRSWRFALQKGDEDDIAFLGFEAASAEAMAEIQNRLGANDVEFLRNVDDLAAKRDVREILSFCDPAGLQVEVFLGQTEKYEEPFLSPAGVSGFVTGDQGFGHVVLASDKADEVRGFYTDVLGLRLSDTIGVEMGPDLTLLLEFFHCNPRHHTLATMPIAMPKRIHHFMLEAKSFDDVGFALDRIQRCGVEQATTLGRHSNDHMVSFYSKTPSGFEVEFGWGGRPVDDQTWKVAHHNATSIWGHKQLA
jgi:biphenyl-2,3-diol 1,2-dioxygenase